MAVYAGWIGLIVTALALLSLTRDSFSQPQPVPWLHPIFVGSLLMLVFYSVFGAAGLVGQGWVTALAALIAALRFNVSGLPDVRFLEAAPTAVVIPVHGGLPLTVRCLDSLRECDPCRSWSSSWTTDLPTTPRPIWLRTTPMCNSSRRRQSLVGGAINAGCDYALEAGARRLILLNNDNVALSRNLLTDLVRLVASVVDASARPS